MDKADGLGTVLFELAKRGWSLEILRDLDIPAEWLPPTYEGPEFTGEITQEAAILTGLRVGHLSVPAVEISRPKQLA